MLLSVVLPSFLLIQAGQACSDVLVTPGASVDGSAMIAYNADSPVLFGSVYHYERQEAVPAGTLRPVYNWDSGVYLGHIPEASETFNVVGNSNEYGLVIGESTFGGVSVLSQQTGAIIDYGSLIWLTLQRSKTVREAISTMAGLMDRYGYVSEGESFSLADATGEVWMMEVIGRGNDFPDEDGSRKIGAVWVAQRIPDGMVAAHANQARITTFARNDPDNFRYSDDVVEVAVHYGLYSSEADPLKFSFSDVYDPVNFLGARQGEARVWSLFSQIAKDPEFESRFESYALGQDLSQRMPLYIEPKQKLSRETVMRIMSSHYEGTSLDSSRDVGSGLFASPYRPRPLVWEMGDETEQRQSGLRSSSISASTKTKYHNERSVATAKTGWSFVAEIRSNMPRELSAVSWYAMDDSSTAPRVPVYGSSRKISPPFAGQGAQDGVSTPLLQMDWNKAFWVQNLVSNWCYSRYSDIYPLLREEIETLQEDLSAKLQLVDANAMELYNTEGASAAVDYVTLFGVNAGAMVHEKWQGLFGRLFAQFRDLYIFEEQEDEPVCGCQANEPGLSETMKHRILHETGDHYKVMESKSGSVDFEVLQGESAKETSRTFDILKQEGTQLS